MRGIANTLAALALTLPAVAAAQSEDLLECPAQEVSAAFRNQLADAMLEDGNPAANDALFEHLATIADGCATRYGLATEKGEAYFTYSLSRLPRDTLGDRLGAAGISAQVVDEAFDFGPGRSNPVISGELNPTQVAALLAGLAANGVEIDKVTDSSWAMIGAYAAASSLMWKARRAMQ